MSNQIERRDFLRTAVVGAAGGALALAGCGRPLSEEEQAKLNQPSQPQLEWWQKPSKPPGQHTLLPLPYPIDGLVIKDDKNPQSPIKGISSQVVTWHHDKHHAGYVKSLNQIEQELAGLKTIEAKANYSTFTELKRRETFNASGMFLHDIYWQNMCPGGQPLTETMPLHQKIVADFGSIERWRDEFVGTGQTPNTGWAILALAPYDGKLHNYACSFHDLGGVWGSIPIVAMDVWEHAYYYDYGPDRGSYIESFLRLLNWSWTSDRFLRWARSLGGALS